MFYYRKDLVDKHGGKQLPKPGKIRGDHRRCGPEGRRCQVRLSLARQTGRGSDLRCRGVITSNGGSILAPDGKSSILGEKAAVEAIQFLHDTINKTKISPQNVLSWDEEPSRQPFTSGEAMFMRNWSYVYPIAQDPKASHVVDKVAVAPLPHFAGGKSAACLGGYQLGVNANSKKREAAIEFLTWMSSPENANPSCPEFRPCALETRDLPGCETEGPTAVHGKSSKRLYGCHTPADHAAICQGDAGSAVRYFQSTGQRQSRG